MKKILWIVAAGLVAGCNNGGGGDAGPDVAADTASPDVTATDVQASDVAIDHGSVSDTGTDAGADGADVPLDLAVIPDGGVDVVDVVVPVDDGTPDTGVDVVDIVVPVDAGTLDTGVDVVDVAVPVDSGVDVGAPDAGVDAGTPDTGPPSALIPGPYPCGSFIPDPTLPASAHELLDVGHQGLITVHRQSGDRILGRDSSFGDATAGGVESTGLGHWVLWDALHGGQIASGAQPCTPLSFVHACPDESGMPFLDMRGNTMVVGSTTTVTVRDISDGHVVTTLPMPTPNATGPFGLASDGSYFWGATATTLTVWSTATGAVRFTRAANYTGATVFASATELLVALGPAGANVIEHLDALTGAQTVTPSFAGTFLWWFLDGSHFMTNASTTAWIYAPDGTLDELVSVPAVPTQGLGNYFWTVPRAGVAPIPLYQLGAGSTPVFTYTGVQYMGAGGDLLAFASLTDPLLHVVQLTPTGPVDTVYPTPNFAGASFATDDADHWSVALYAGLLYDGRTLTAPGGPHSLSCGTVLDISGSPSGAAAVSTLAGVVVLNLQPAAQTVSGSFARVASSTQWSSDGSVLVAGVTNNQELNDPDRSLYEYAMPSGVPLAVLSYTSGAPGTTEAWFALSRDGTTLGQARVQSDAARVLTPVREVTTLAGTVTFTDPMPADIAPVISPSGALVTLTGPGTGTRVFNAGVLVGAADQLTPVAWIDDTRFLARQYSGSTYVSTGLYATSGSLISTVPGLGPAAGRAPESFVPPNAILAPVVPNYRLYDLTTGAVLWTSAISGYPDLGQSAAAGGFIVTRVGHAIVVEAH